MVFPIEREGFAGPSRRPHFLVRQKRGGEGRPDPFITLRRLEIENTHKEENNMRSNKAHRLLALLLTFVMTFSLLPTVTWAATSGDCSADDGSSSVTWSYDANTTTLTISGTGAMADYGTTTSARAPWYSQRGTVTKITVSEGVTRIGAFAFNSYAKLTSVSLPTTLESIGDSAFISCTSLTDTNFLPSTDISMGDSVFAACTGIAVIAIPDGWTKIDAGAFASITQATAIAIPSTVKEIGAAAFKSCTKVATVSIPDSVTKIGNDAFADWTIEQTLCFDKDKDDVLSAVTFGDGWNGNALIDYNGERVYPFAFNGTYTYEENSVNWAYDLDTKTLSFIGTGAFDIAAGTTITEEVYPWLRFTAYVEHVVFSDGLTSIPDSVISNATKLRTVKLPSTLVTVGAGAFKGCTAVSWISLPSSVRTIGVSAFANWTVAQIINIEMSAEDFANKDVMWYASDWNAKAVVTYLEGPDIAWANNAVITLDTDQGIFTGVVDLEARTVTFSRDMSNPAPFTLTQVTASVTGADGSAEVPDNLEMVTYSGKVKFRGTDQITLVPANGTNGDRISLIVFFQITWIRYTFSGKGTEKSPYLIKNANDLVGLAAVVNAGNTMAGKYLRQTADIDMTGVPDWTPIAKATTSGSSRNPFSGTYDGRGHRIKNFVYNNAETSYFGLFGVLGESSVVKSIVLDESCSITAKSYVGGIAARSFGRIEDCVNYGKVTATGTAGQVPTLMVGGIVGNGKVLTNCANYGDVTGNPNASGFSSDGGTNVGGIAGNARILVNCRNYGAVIGGGLVGGVVGQVSDHQSTLENPMGVVSGCANYGTVNAREKAGGLVGLLGGIMEDCYNQGTVKVEKTTVGGLVGIANTNRNANGRGDMAGVFNSYHTGSVQYGSEEAEPVAGHLIGSATGVDVNGKSLGNLYYQEVGILPAIGNYDAGDYATAMPLTAMQAQEFVDKLNGYANISLYGVTWTQGDSESQNLPVCGSFETLKDYACDLTGLTVNDSAALLDKNGNYYFVLPYDADLAKVTVATTVSPRATVTPADGAVDFSNGRVDFVVTAEDGTHSKTYPVTVTKAASLNGLSMLRLNSWCNGSVDPSKNNGYDGAVLVDPNDFKQDTTSYSSTQYDLHVVPLGLDNTGTNSSYRFWAIPAETGATMTAAIGETTKTINPVTDMMGESAEYIQYGSLLKLGENTLTLTVTPPTGGNGKETVYTFKLTVLPTLKTVTFAEGGLEQDQAFAPETLDYTLKVPDSVKSLTPTVTATLSDGVTVTYSPELENGKLPLDKLENGKFTITVSGTEAGATSTTYTYTVETIGTYDAKITTNATGAQVRVYQGDTLVTPGKNGVYSLRTDKSYRYVAVAKGYVTKTGTITQSALNKAGELTVTLSAAPTLSLTKYDAFWPNFRGNDQNMAITSVKTPTGQIDAETESSDVELLWASASGSGYDSGAVGSPIFVDGYMYAYAGTKLLKLDPATGATVAYANMASNSDFAIIPPTYADGMIFVALKEGRVQAFRADTLESLWVYQDPLKGQSNSPITYSDGYVYVGFWNGESGDANFVCLTADYEGTSTKEALWRYTSKGGFYWAGAYANDKYVVVGTDDGQSGYTSQTAKLVVFDKFTGEIVDSKTDYTGDIRSNIAYADGRVYFTSKGGYFYSEVLGDNGKLSGSQAINLGGMSTSTPVVYNNRAYVGVSGDGQFTAYSGHHIAVLDLNSWSVAYTAATQGYPQTSGLLSTNTEDGSVNVYFMDNYTPGVMRVINDSANQTSLKGGITENGKSNCAPVVFKPEGPLAQYCISSPVVDEYGTLYFKNDSGNLIALTSAVKELVVKEMPEVTKGDDGDYTAEGGKIVALLANSMERDVTKLVTYRDAADGSVEAVYTYGINVGNYTLSTKAVSLTGASESDIKIGNGSVDGTTVDGVTTFKAGTSADAPEIKVTAPAAGWKLGESNAFTVASENDAACVVLVKKADGTYQKLTATTANGTHSFTATLAADDEIIVMLNGDMNGDGLVNATDATLVSRACLSESHRAYRALSDQATCAIGTPNAAAALMINRACLSAAHKAYKAMSW